MSVFYLLSTCFSPLNILVNLSPLKYFHTDNGSWNESEKYMSKSLRLCRKVYVYVEKFTFRLKCLRGHGLCSQALLNLILYGSPTLNETDNRILLEASIAYIKATNRLKERAPGGSVG